MHHSISTYSLEPKSLERAIHDLYHKYCEKFGDSPKWPFPGSSTIADQADESVNTILTVFTEAIEIFCKNEAGYFRKEANTFTRNCVEELLNNLLSPDALANYSQPVEKLLRIHRSLQEHYILYSIYQSEAKIQKMGCFQAQEQKIFFHKYRIKYTNWRIREKERLEKYSRNIEQILMLKTFSHPQSRLAMALAQATLEDRSYNHGAISNQTLLATYTRFFTSLSDQELRITNALEKHEQSLCELETKFIELEQWPEKLQKLQHNKVWTCEGLAEKKLTLESLERQLRKIHDCFFKNKIALDSELNLYFEQEAPAILFL